jgi:hypothetical protein
LGAAICFWFAGIHYEKFKQEQAKKEKDALDKVSEFNIAMETKSIANLLKMDLRGLTLDSIDQGEASEYF